MGFCRLGIPVAVFSPEPLDASQTYGFTALQLITDTIPERIAVMCDSRISMFVPVTFDFFHKLGVFFPFFIEDFKDWDAISVSTAKATTVRIGTFFPHGVAQVR